MSTLFGIPERGGYFVPPTPIFNTDVRYSNPSLNPRIVIKDSYQALQEYLHGSLQERYDGMDFLRNEAQDFLTRARRGAYFDFRQSRPLAKDDFRLLALGVKGAARVSDSNAEQEAYGYTKMVFALMQSEGKDLPYYPTHEFAAPRSIADHVRRIMEIAGVVQAITDQTIEPHELQPANAKFLRTHTFFEVGTRVASLVTTPAEIEAEETSKLLLRLFS